MVTYIYITLPSVLRPQEGQQNSRKLHKSKDTQVEPPFAGSMLAFSVMSMGVSKSWTFMTWQWDDPLGGAVAAINGWNMDNFKKTAATVKRKTYVFARAPFFLKRVHDKLFNWVLFSGVLSCSRSKSFTSKLRETCLFLVPSLGTKLYKRKTQPGGSSLNCPFFFQS